MQLSIEQFLEKQKPSCPPSKAINECNCISKSISKFQCGMCNEEQNVSSASNMTLRQRILQIFSCKYQWLHVTGDSLPVRTKFITKVNKSDVHKLTIAQVYENVTVLEIIPKIQDWASCMHMQAGLIVFESEEHILHFFVDHEYGGKCNLRIDTHDTDLNTKKVCYVLMTRTNF